MPFLHRKKRQWSFFVLFYLIFLIPATLNADINKLENRVSNTLSKEIETQKINEKWETEKRSLKDKYKFEAEKDTRLTRQLEQLQKRFALQQKKHNEFIRKQNEVKRIENELNSLLENIVTELETFINRDLPFHKEERLTRLNEIKAELLINDSRPAERYRQVFEALQIETDYGKNIEVYNKKVNLGQDERLVDILRIGRVSLFCLTPDKKTAAKYNPLKKEWEIVSSKLKKEIEKGILTAKGEKTAELVKLPFGRIAR